MASAATTASHALRLPRLRGEQRLFVFASALGLLTALLWLVLLRGSLRPDTALSVPWWGALAACYAGGLITVDLGIRRRFTVSLAEVPLALGLFVVDPLVLVGCYCVAILLASWTRRGLQASSDYGNLLLNAAFVTVAVLVFAAVRPDAADPLAARSILALVAAMSVAGCVVGPAALVASIGVYRGRLLRHDATHAFVSQAAGTVASTSLAVVALGLAGSRPWFCIAMVPPLLLVLGLHATAVRARGSADSAGFLLRVDAILQRSTPVNDRAGELLAAIAQTFDAGSVELVLTGDQRTTALHFRITSGDDRVQTTQSDLSAGELDALRSLDDRHVSTVRADANDMTLVRLADERGMRTCAACTLQGADQAQGLLLLDRAPRSRGQTDLLLATASLIGAAAARGELMTRDRRRGGRTARGDRQAAPQILRGRPAFADAVTMALGRVPGTRRPLAALVIDLDGFMGIRGTYGDTIADAMLTTVASRLRQHLRRYDVMAYLGRERLGLLLDSLRHGADAEVVAGRLLSTLQQAVELGGHSMTLGGSVGIAVVDDFGDVPSTDELIHRADMAVYLAKRQAATRYVVFDSGARQPIIASASAPQS